MSGTLNEQMESVQAPNAVAKILLLLFYIMLFSFLDYILVATNADLKRRSTFEPNNSLSDRPKSGSNKN